jgi:hypothetical protein
MGVIQQQARPAEGGRTCVPRSQSSAVSTGGHHDAGAPHTALNADQASTKTASRYRMRSASRDRSGGRSCGGGQLKMRHNAGMSETGFTSNSGAAAPERRSTLVPRCRVNGLAAVSWGSLHPWVHCGPSTHEEHRTASTCRTASTIERWWPAGLRQKRNCK